MFKRMSVKMKLYAVIGFLSVLLIAIGALGLMGMSKANEGLYTVYQDRAVPLMDLGLMADMVNRIRTNAVLASNVGKTDMAEKLTADTRDLDGEIDKLWSKYMATTLTPEEKQLADTFAERWKHYQVSRDRTMKSAMQGDFVASRENAAKDAGPKFTLARETMFKLIELQGAVAKHEYETAQARYSTIRLISIVAIIFGVLLAFGVGYLLIRGIVNPLNAAIGHFEQIGQGNFNNKIEITQRDEIGKVLEAIADMQSKMAANLAAEAKVQEEINTLINAAARGDLSQRVALEGKQGFMKKLGEGMNDLLEVLAAAMDDVAQALDAMARGDLTVSIAKDYQGTFGKLKNDINATVAKLTEVVSSIKESADLIKTASMEISMGNTNLSQRTQEQASALEETASSMEEMTSTVKQNADNTKQANQLVSGARAQASEGGEVVTKAVGAMEAISGSSKKIADIISVIDEIAFQTNLLALNAAVEAARAGEQGRGFAVVATEVRNLAQRSAEAAKEIKDLINDSVEKVDTGSKLVDSSGTVLSEIVGSVKNISDIVAEIAAASQEQASGIEQVNKAVMQMDEMTQQNAALVEQAAAASKSMEEQAVNLSEQITFFRFSDAGKTVKDSPRKPAAVSAVASSARDKSNGGAHPARKPVAVPKVAAGGAGAPIPAHLTAKPGWRERKGLGRFLKGNDSG